MFFVRYLFLLTACQLSYLAFAQQKQPVIAFTSDTQEPMGVEKLFLKADHNVEATKLIFEDIDRLHPAALFILGDVVSLGKSKRAWKNIDNYLGQATLDSIPVYATLGNHEVMFNAKKGTRNFRARFPMFDPAGYVKIVDSVAVILLNSNFSKMSKQEISAQNAWYRHKLEELDKDPGVRCIIVGCHHSPYTNSRVVKPSAAVQQDFVPPFIKSKKCILFLSGHSHNFERFRANGKDFMVIGGGGGLHQPLNSNNAQMHDLSENYKPAFHYLEVMRTGDSLQIISRKLRQDRSGFDDGLSLNVHFLKR